MNDIELSNLWTPAFAGVTVAIAREGVPVATAREGVTMPSARGE